MVSVLEDAGIPRERVISVDSTKVDEALEVTELASSDVYEIEEREYVRKPRSTKWRRRRGSGAEDRLAATEGAEAEELREEIEELERRINDLTSFRSDAEV